MDRAYPFRGRLRLLSFLLSCLGALALSLALPLPGNSWPIFFVVLSTIAAWATEVVPPFVASLGCQLLLLIPGLVPADQVLGAGWLNHILWLIVGAYIIGAAISRCRLAERVSYLLFQRLGGGWARTVGVFYLLGIIFAYLIPSVLIKVVLFISVAVTIADMLGYPPRSRAASGLSLAAAMGAVMPVMISYTGWELIPLAMELIGQERRITWLGWMGYNFLPGIIWTGIVYLVNVAMFHPGHSFRLDRSLFRDRVKRMGPLSRDELKVMVLLVLLMLLWVFEEAHGIKLGWVTLAVGLVLYVPGLGPLTEADFRTEVNWSFIIFYSGVLTVGRALSYSGINEWLAKALIPAGLVDWPLFVQTGFVGAIAQVLHLVLGAVTPMYLVAVPVVAGYAALNGLLLLPLIFSVVWSGKRWFLPHQEVAVFLCLGYDYTSRGDVIKIGLVLSALMIPFIAFVATPLWLLAQRLTGLAMF